MKITQTVVKIGEVNTPAYCVTHQDKEYHIAYVTQKNTLRFFEAPDLPEKYYLKIIDKVTKKAKHKFGISEVYFKEG